MNSRHKIASLWKVFLFFLTVYLSACRPADSAGTSSKTSSPNSAIKIFIEGAVQHPGMMTLDAHSTLKDAITKAGLTSVSQTDECTLIRKTNNFEKKIKVNCLKVLHEKENSSDNITLQSGDKLIVPFNKLLNNYDTVRPLAP